jgi:lipoate-protein ligase A
MTCNYIITECTNPYENLAYEELLMDIVEPDTYLLYLWQNENTIVIGRNQDAYAELNVESFRNDSGRLARRLSGGGAVYHDLGNLNFTLMAHNSIFDKKKHYDIILQTMRSLGLNAEFNGRNDVTIDGRKFSGNAFYDNGRVSFQHGTLLINSDITKMQKFLTPDKSKLQRNRVKSVSSRVVNLVELLPKLTVDMVQQALIETVSGTPLSQTPDVNLVNERTRFNASYDWILRGIGL